jgi:hypothetical protein
MTLARRFIVVVAAAALAALAIPSLAQGELVKFTGQLLDVRNGYVYFTTGDAFKLSAAPKYADYDTGGATPLQPHAKLYARAILDPATKMVVELDLTTRRLPNDATYATVAQQFGQTRAATERAPEIVGKRVTGKEVPVTFTVTVPPSTSLRADVYISTDVSNWNPQAIKMDRIDGQRYRAVRRFASGTRFFFRVTRGTWNSVERGQDGLEQPAREFVVNEVDSQGRDVTVASWSDDRPNAGSQVAAPGAIPTPFNPNPFPPGGIAPAPRVTPPGGFPTPRPGPPNQPPH